MSVNPRMNRLFVPNGKCLQVAMDHGVANEASVLSGIENMRQVVGTIAAANPDAMLLTAGQAHWLQDLPQRPKPALAVRGCRELRQCSDAGKRLLYIDSRRRGTGGAPGCGRYGGQPAMGV